MYTQFNKHISKATISDFGEIVTRIAQKDKNTAMDLYGENPITFVRREIGEDIFTKSGKLSKKGLAELRQDLINDAKDEFKLSNKEAKKMFDELKIADIYPGITKTSNISTEELLSKKIGELDSSDYGKLAEQIARVDKNLALDLYGSNTDDFLFKESDEIREIFLPNGKIAPKIKEEINNEIAKHFKLTPKDAEKLTVKDLLEYTNTFRSK